jgi:hypothetical protein
MHEIDHCPASKSAAIAHDGRDVEKPQASSHAATAEKKFGGCFSSDSVRKARG